MVVLAATLSEGSDGQARFNNTKGDGWRGGTAIEGDKEREYIPISTKVYPQEEHTSKADSRVGGLKIGRLVCQTGPIARHRG